MLGADTPYRCTWISNASELKEDTELCTHYKTNAALILEMGTGNVAFRLGEIRLSHRHREREREEERQRERESHFSHKARSRHLDIS